MLRSHKKNILIGLLAIGVFGLVYGFLSSRPEMVVDEALRVSEESRPELDHVMARSSAFKSTEPALSGETLSSIGSAGVGGERLVSEMQGSLDNNEISVVGTSDNEVNVISTTTLENDIAEPLQNHAAVTSGQASPDERESVQVTSVKDPFVNPFKSGARRFTPEEIAQDNVVKSEAGKLNPQRASLINPSNSDVALISEQSGFLDLNLTKTKPLEVVLLEGDEIIIDDVNETLDKYKPLAKDVEEANDSAGKATVASIDGDGMGITSPVVLSDLDEVQDQSSGLIVLPDLDEKLMNGTDAVSLEYQASYKKLKSITERLNEANEENKYLKNQFSQVAEDNNKLAQIIRDIDEKIKVLTVNN